MTENIWRDLALQFDNHRIMAIWHIRMLLNHPEDHAERAREFLNAAPKSGKEIHNERVAARLKGLTPVAWRYRFTNIDGNLTNWILSEEKPEDVWYNGERIPGLEVEPLYN